jgi:flagellar basal body rod protein FlgF
MANKILFDVLGQIVNSSGPLPVNSQVLGSGFEVISVGKKKLVRSVPTELNKDHNGILELAQVCNQLLIVYNTTVHLTSMWMLS